MKHQTWHNRFLSLALALASATSAPGAATASESQDDASSGGPAAEQPQADERAQREQENARRRDQRARELYERGTQALDQRRWQQAAEAFDQVARAGGARAEGALYWKAYALAKLGQRAAALAVLESLYQAAPAGRWTKDAKALELELRQAAGQSVPPEQESDEELKLIAINSLLHSEPERAVPLLEKLLAGSSSPRMQERALFVLSQSGSARALELVAQVARGQANPDLQRKAIEYLGLFGEQAGLALLEQIYAASADLEIKRAILHGFMVADDHQRLAQAARGEKQPELRAEAIRQLGVTGSTAELGELYKSESSAPIKQAILEALFIADDLERLLEILRAERDPRLRKEAIVKLGLTGERKAAEALVGLYSAAADVEERRAVLQALFVGDQARALIEVARKETNPTLRREAVEKLSHMDSPEAVQYMMELLDK